MSDSSKLPGKTVITPDPELQQKKNTKTITDTSGKCVDCKKNFLWISVHKRCQPCEIKATDRKPARGGEIILKSSYSEVQMQKETKKRNRPVTNNIIVDLVRQLKKIGASATQAAKALNTAGHKTATGLAWSSSNISFIYYVKLKDVEREKSAPAIEQIRVPTHKEVESRLETKPAQPEPAPAAVPKEDEKPDIQIHLDRITLIAQTFATALIEAGEAIKKEIKEYRS